MDQYYLRLKCYHCSAIMESWDHSAGKRSRCPRCDAPIRIPQYKYFQQFHAKKVMSIKVVDWAEDPWRPENFPVVPPSEHEPYEYAGDEDSSIENQEQVENDAIRENEPSVLTVNNTPTVTQPEQDKQEIVDSDVIMADDDSEVIMPDEDDMVVEDLDFVEPSALGFKELDEESDLLDL